MGMNVFSPVHVWVIFQQNINRGIAMVWNQTKEDRFETPDRKPYCRRNAAPMPGVSGTPAFSTIPIAIWIAVTRLSIVLFSAA